MEMPHSQTTNQRKAKYIAPFPQQGYSNTRKTVRASKTGTTILDGVVKSILSKLVIMLERSSQSDPFSGFDDYL